MSFENKYIKYKNKYFELINNKQGGFMMSYETKDYHFKKYITNYIQYTIALIRLSVP